MHPGGQRLPVGQIAIGGGILDEYTEAVTLIKGVGNIADDQIDAQRLGPRGEHLKCLWVAAVIGQEHGCLALVHAVGEGHRLSGSGGLIEQRGVGNLHAGQITDHRLEGQHRLHPALGNLGLIGCVGGVPGRILQNVSLDHRWRMRAVVALPDETLEQQVALGDAF